MMTDDEILKAMARDARLHDCAEEMLALLKRAESYRIDDDWLHKVRKLLAKLEGK